MIVAGMFGKNCTIYKYKPYKHIDFKGTLWVVTNGIFCCCCMGCMILTHSRETFPLSWDLVSPLNSPLSPLPSPLSPLPAPRSPLSLWLIHTTLANTSHRLHQHVTPTSSCLLRFTKMTSIVIHDTVAVLSLQSHVCMSNVLSHLEVAIRGSSSSNQYPHFLLTC